MYYIFNILSNISSRDELAAPLEPDPALLEALRQWRTEQARTQSVPPYIIFSNKILEAIAAQKPATPEDLRQIAGVGPAKLEQYGQAVINLVGQHLDQTAPNDITPEPDPPLQIKETTATPHRPTKTTDSVAEAILAVVTDLEGLITADGLAQLLTAGPDDIVSFSDHDLFGQFHGRLDRGEVLAQIRAEIEAGRIAESPYKKLMVGRNA